MMLKLLELKEYIKQIGDKHGVSVKIFAKLIAAFTIFSLFFHNSFFPHFYVIKCIIL